MAEEFSPDPEESASGERHDEREMPRNSEIADPSASAEAHLTVGNSALTFDLLHFQYHYPKGFSKADQNAIEEALLSVKRTAAAKEIASYDDLSTAKYDWVLEVVFGAAPVFGRVAARNKWSPNQIRNTFRNYADLAAAAAQLTKPELLMLLARKIGKNSIVPSFRPLRRRNWRH